MSDIIKRQVPVLALNGKNYQTWALDCELHLQGMQLSHTITARPNDAAPPPPHEQAQCGKTAQNNTLTKALVFPRH